MAIPQSGLLSQVSSLRMPLGHSGPVLTLSNAAYASLSSPRLLVVDVSIWAASPLGVAVKHVICGVYLFIYFSSLLCSLWDSKAHHRPARESVFWCLVTSLFLRLPSRNGSPSLPVLSLFIFYILSYLLSKTMGCLSGCLMSSTSIQKLFCGICSAFKCSFDEFVGRKWFPRPIPPSS